MREPAKQAEERCQAGLLGGGDWPPNTDACTVKHGENVEFKVLGGRNITQCGI